MRTRAKITLLVATVVLVMLPGRAWAAPSDIDTSFGTDGIASQFAGCGGSCTFPNDVTILDGRGESPGESLSRIRIRQHDLPPPELQHVLHDDTGAFLGRADFFWTECGVVGEFDGMGKYGVDGGQAAVAVHREKLREDAIRDAGTRSSGGRGGTSSTSPPSRRASTGRAHAQSTGADRRSPRHSPDSGTIAPDSDQCL